MSLVVHYDNPRCHQWQTKLASWQLLVPQVKTKLASFPLLVFSDIHMFVVLNLDALAQAIDFQIERRQVVFLCLMQNSNQGLWNWISSRLNARWQTNWVIEDQSKNLNSIARPYDQPAFSPLDSTSWLSHLALVIYMFVVVNFDALEHASNFQIKRRQVVFLCNYLPWCHMSIIPSQISSFFMLKTKKASKLCITGPFWRKSCWWLVDSPHKGPVMQGMFPCPDNIMPHLQVPGNLRVSLSCRVIILWWIPHTKGQ